MFCGRSGSKKRMFLVRVETEGQVPAQETSPGSAPTPAEISAPLGISINKSTAHGYTTQPRCRHLTQQQPNLESRAHPTRKARKHQKQDETWCCRPIRTAVTNINLPSLPPVATTAAMIATTQPIATTPAPVSAVTPTLTSSITPSGPIATTPAPLIVTFSVPIDSPPCAACFSCALGVHRYFSTTARCI